MTRTPQEAIPILVIIVLAHGFCNHIARLVPKERSPNAIMSVVTITGKKFEIVSES